MNDAIMVLLTVLGGLGIFLLGMKNLSEGLQSVAGGGLRKFMKTATAHRTAGVGMGIVSTILVQSSSVITVMLVSFVSSGFMSLQQAFNVIIGANIGTTATVWIVAFAPDPQILGLSGAAAGGALYFFFRNEKTRDAGLSILGLGMVFLGMYFMSKGVLPIRQHDSVRELLARLDAKTFHEVALAAGLSAVFTAIVQSSAATIAIAMTLASQRLIGYETAISVLFGANIGTTATAWLAAIGGTTAAKRTALSHTLSNLIGSLVFLPLVLPIFVPLGKSLFPNWATVTETAKGPVLLGVMAPIAVTDTIFSILRGALFLPLAKPFTRLVEKMLPQKEHEKPHLSALKTRAISPIVACDLALVEVAFMRDSNLDLFACAKTLLSGGTDESMERHVANREGILDNVQREITEYLGEVMKKRLSKNVADRARKILRLADELESASDEAAKIVKAIKRIRGDKMAISNESTALLLELSDKTDRFTKEVSLLVKSPHGTPDMAAVLRQSENIRNFAKECRQRQIARVGADGSSPLKVLGELDIINAYDRTRSCYLNIAETLAGGKRTE